MTVMDFKPLNLRDFTYVFANMRAEDRDELMCQLPEGITHAQAQQIISGSIMGPSFSAHDSTGPIACFGAAESGISHIFIGWAFGTKRFKRVAPFVGTFMWEVMAPMLVDHGCKRVEVRSKHDHVLATRWLPTLGFRQEAVLRGWARTGEDFNLWSITIRDYHNRNKRVN